MLPLDKRWWGRKVNLLVVRLVVGWLLALLMHVVLGKRHILHLDVIINLFLFLGLVFYDALLVH